MAKYGDRMRTAPLDVNNAGYGDVAPFKQLNSDGFKAVVDTNCYARMTLFALVGLTFVYGTAPSDWVKAIFLWFMTTFFVAGVAGSSLGWIAVRGAASRISPLKPEIDYPPARRLLDDGWRAL